MDKILILFTMKGCPYCEIMKESLNENNIEYFVRDINQHKEEYDLFVEATKNEFVPAFIIIDDDENNPKSYLYAPERDFNEISDGIKIIKEHFKGVNE